MRGMFSNLGRFSVAIATFLIMFSFLAVYLFIYVPSQKDYFTKRNLRILNVMSTQIKSKIENFGGVIHNIVDGIETRNAAALVSQRIALVPGLKLKGDPVITGVAEGAHKEAHVQKEHTHGIELHAEFEGSHYALHFEYEGHVGAKEDSSIKIHASSNLNDVLTPIVGRSEFDDLLVVQMKRDTLSGKEEAVVIYQRSGSELSIAKFDTLEDSGGRKFLFNSQINNSNVKDIRLLGTDYKLLLRPFAITLHQEEVESEQTEKWVLVGFIEANRFNSESRAISKHLVFLFFLFVVIAILSLPIIKVRFIGQKDSLKLLDIALLGYSLLIAISLITISMLNVYSYLSTQIRMDDQLELLAEEITAEFRLEAQQALAQLAKFNEVLLKTNRGPQINMFKKDMIALGDPYSFFEMAFWADSSGQQKTKWSIRDQTTALVNISSRDYFNNVKRNKLWTLRDSSGTSVTEAFSLQPVYSLTTGQNETIFAIPFQDDPAAKGSRLKSAYLVTRMTSLLRPVLPVGQGFAIIEKDGKVLFHSDEKKNLQENLFRECDDNELLRAFVFGRSRDYLDVKYMGRDHRFYVLPMQDLPWTLVTFRDQEIFRTINTELIAVAIGMFVAYLLVISVFITLVWVIIFLFRRLRRSPRLDSFWLWPEYGKRGVYSFAIVAFMLLNLLFAYRILYYTIDEVLYTTAVLPLLGIVLFYVLVREPSQSSVIRMPFKSLWSRESMKVIVPSSAFDARFVGVLICLMGLIGVLPSVAFFKISHKMEADLLIKHRQLKFAEVLETREERIRKDYEKVNFGKTITRERFLESRLALKDATIIDTTVTWASTDLGEAAKNTLVEYDVYGSGPFVLSTHSVNDPKCQRKRWPHDPRWKQEGEQHVDRDQHIYHGFERELAHMMLLYNNQTTIEVRELIHDESDDRLWYWEPHEGTGKLTLHKGGFFSDRCLQITSFFPTFGVSFWQGPGWWRILQILLAVFALIVIVGFFVLLRLLVRKLFLTDFSLADSPGSEIRLANSLLINPPESVRKRLLKNKDVHVVDLLECARKENWSEDFDYGLLPPQKNIAVDHFEYKLSDAQCNDEKVRFLEKLIYTHKKDVMLISNVDPTDFNFTEGAVEPGKESGQAAASRSVFSLFQKQLVLDHGDPEALTTEYLALKEELMKIPVRKKRKHCLEMCDLLYEECLPTAELNKIGLEILRRREFVYFDRAELISTIQEQANSYYRKIWLSCSIDERLGLVDLAKDSFANLSNRRVIQSLLRSGLMARHPGFRLMNESLKKFVIEESKKQQVMTWAKQSSPSSWGKLRMPLAIVLAGVLLFLFSTQPSSFKSTISIISAVTAGIPTLIKILGSLKFGKSGGTVEA